MPSSARSTPMRSPAGAGTAAEYLSSDETMSPTAADSDEADFGGEDVRDGERVALLEGPAMAPAAAATSRPASTASSAAAHTVRASSKASGTSTMASVASSVGQRSRSVGVVPQRLKAAPKQPPSGDTELLDAASPLLTDMRVIHRTDMTMLLPGAHDAALASPLLSRKKVDAPGSARSCRSMALGLLCLVVGLTGLSAVAPLMDYVHHTGDCLKTSWRSMLYICLFLPGSVRGIWKDRRRDQAWRPVLGWSLVAGLAYSYWMALFVVSLALTSIAHSVLYSNMHAVVLVLLKVALRKPVTKFECAGVVVGVIGGALCALDSTFSGSRDSSLWGDLLAFGSSFGGAAYLSLSKRVQGKIDVFSFAVILHVVCAGCMMAAAYVVDPSPPSWTDPLNPTVGVLGWTVPEAHRLYVMLVMAVWSGLLGQFVYLISLRVVPAVVVALLSLLEPVIANAIGIVLDVASLPGPWTYAGGVLLLLGAYIVLDPQHHQFSDGVVARYIRTRVMSATEPSREARSLLQEPV